MISPNTETVVQAALVKPSALSTDLASWMQTHVLAKVNLGKNAAFNIQIYAKEIDEVDDCRLALQNLRDLKADVLDSFELEKERIDQGRADNAQYVIKYEGGPALFEQGISEQDLIAVPDYKPYSFNEHYVRQLSAQCYTNETVDEQNSKGNNYKSSGFLYNMLIPAIFKYCL